MPEADQIPVVLSVFVQLPRFLEVYQRFLAQIVSEEGANMPTAMIVDDNATLAYFTARNLERGIDGLNVLTAASCEEARKTAEKLVPSVLIADIKLTDGNGIDLVDEMLERFPGMSAILISGVVPTRSFREDLSEFLLKPYEAEELVAAVTRALKGVKSPIKTTERVHLPRCSGYDHHKLRKSAWPTGCRFEGIWQGLEGPS